MVDLPVLEGFGYVQVAFSSECIALYVSGPTTGLISRPISILVFILTTRVIRAVFVSKILVTDAHASNLKKNAPVLSVVPRVESFNQFSCLVEAWLRCPFYHSSSIVLGGTLLLQAFLLELSIGDHELVAVVYCPPLPFLKNVFV